MYLTLSGLAGDDIKHSARTMVRIANLLHIAVDSKFNDVTLLANPGGSAEQLINEYTEQSKLKRTFKFASSGGYKYDEMKYVPEAS